VPQGLEIGTAIFSFSYNPSAFSLIYWYPAPKKPNFPGCEVILLRPAGQGKQQ
jgi:hypothetical protein